MKQQPGTPVFPLFTEVEDSPGDQEGRKDVVVIDSLFVMDQFKAAERVSVGRPHTRDIAEVTAVAEAVLPKGSARISTAVRRARLGRAGCSLLPLALLRPGARGEGTGDMLAFLFLSPVVFPVAFQ